MRYRMILAILWVTILGLGVAFRTRPVLAENIDPNADSSQYAYGENVGWLNAEPSGNGGPGVEVEGFNLTGYIWAENIGWLSLSCANTSSCARVDYGVTNDGRGNLSGYAWGENVGWISFSCENTGSCSTVDYGVSIDFDTGEFRGKAWGENIGWISFRSAGPVPFGLRSSWKPDTDGDGMADWWEIQYFTNLGRDGSLDRDDDGLVDSAEFAYETDPTHRDSDGDGVTDGDEVAAGTDPNTEVTVTGVKGDLNGDGLTDLADVIIALQVLSGRIPNGIRSDYASSAADVNGDGRIGTEEGLYAIQVAGGTARLTDDPELLDILYPTPIPVLPPTSFDKIDAAYRRGEITETEAMRFRIFAGYSPERLPEQYVGDMRITRGSLQLADTWLQENFQSLNPELQSELRPYYVLPDDPDSIFSNQPQMETAERLQQTYTSLNNSSTTGWSHITVTVPGVDRDVYPIPDRSARIYYPDGDAAAREQADWIGQAFLYAYPRFTRLLDEQLNSDVYIFVYPELGVAGLGGMRTIEGVRCGLILVRKEMTEEKTKSTLAHELFHVFQRQMGLEEDTPEQRWLREATAVWSQHFIYPNYNDEHRWLSGFFRDLDKQMISIGEEREYETYPWFLYLTQAAGYDERVRQILEDAAEGNATDAAVGFDGFDSYFADFALWNWNQRPVEYYEDNPNFPGSPRGGDAYGYTCDPGGRRFLPDQQHSCAVQTGPLSMLYDPLVFDDLVQKIVFRFIEGEGDSWRRRQALVRVNNEWHVEDWTYLLERTFCRNRPQERVEIIILIFSNAHREEDLFHSYELDTHGECEPRLHGTIQISNRYDFHEEGTHLTLSGDYTVRTIKSSSEFSTQDELVQNEDGDLVLERSYASGSEDYLEKIVYSRECGTLWESKKETTRGSHLEDWTGEEWKPVSLEAIKNEDGEITHMRLRPRLMNNGFSNRVDRAILDFGCIIGRLDLWTDQEDHTSGVSTPFGDWDFTIEVDFSQIEIASGEITIPCADRPEESCSTTIRYRYACE